MAKKILLIAFLLLAISTEELMARNMFRAYREMDKRPKRDYGCTLVGIPCDVMYCDPEASCEGRFLACYNGLCGKAGSNPYKRKRSVDLPKEI